MEGRFSVKAILVGFLVQIFSGAIFATVTLVVAALSRGAGSLSAFGANLQIMVTSFFQSPFFIPAVLAMSLLSCLLGGYVTGMLAPRAEMKNAAGVVALSLIFTFATRSPVAAPPNAATPFWFAPAAWLITIFATLGGALWRARRAAAPSHRNGGTG